MKVKENFYQGLNDAISKSGKNKGKFKVKSPSMNTFGCAVWQAYMYVFAPFKMSVGSVIMMDEDTRSVYNFAVKQFEGIAYNDCDNSNYAIAE